MNKITLMLGTIVLFSVMGLASSCLADDDFGGGDIMYESAKFSHEAHVGGMGFECDSCHDGLFEMESGAATHAGNFTMQNINKGLYCGGCHNGSTAFAGTEQCDSCHIKAGGEIVYDEPVKAVLFSHKNHQENGFDCDACHSGTFKMSAKAAQQNADFTMKGLAEGKYCGICHDGDSAFDSDTLCATCHIGVKGYKRLSSDHELQPQAHH